MEFDSVVTKSSMGSFNTLKEYDHFRFSDLQCLCFGGFFVRPFEQRDVPIVCGSQVVYHQCALGRLQYVAILREIEMGCKDKAPWHSDWSHLFHRVLVFWIFLACCMK